MPFHKLSQWLAYSLFEPFERAGIAVSDGEKLTALPEYRNGGLFIDCGALVPRDPALLAVERGGYAFDDGDRVIGFKLLRERFADVASPGAVVRPDEWHGEDGPLCVSDLGDLPIADAFVEAAEQCGYRRNPDFNGAAQEGFGYYQFTTRKGRRCSTAVGYLKSARRRANLNVVSHALATRVLFEGRRAVGVRYNQDKEVRARREVIVCAGTVNSPKLLQLSGIGPAAQLRDLGLAVVHDLPGVGENLRDHYTVRIAARAKNAVTLNELSRGWREAPRLETLLSC